MGPTSPALGRRRQNLKDEIATYVRDLIFAGELKPGEKILQGQIAIDLGVSKLPVREAMIALESDGIVRNVPRQGSFVEMLEPDDVIDHYEIFGMLSGLAAERAAERLTDQAIAELERLVAAIDGTDDPAEQAELNWRFHQIINRAGSSRRLRSVLRSLVKGIPTRFFEQTRDWAHWGNKDHRAIIEALRSGDGKAAAHLMQSHLARSGSFAVDGLRAIGFWDETRDPESSE